MVGPNRIRWFHFRRWAKFNTRISTACPLVDDDTVQIEKGWSSVLRKIKWPINRLDRLRIPGLTCGSLSEPLLFEHHHFELAWGNNPAIFGSNTAGSTALFRSSSRAACKPYCRRNEFPITISVRWLSIIEGI